MGFLFLLFFLIITSCGTRQETLLIITDSVSSYLLEQTGFELPRNIKNYRIDKTIMDQDFVTPEKNYSGIIFITQSIGDFYNGEEDGNTFHLKFPLIDFHDSNILDEIQLFFHTIMGKIESDDINTLFWIVEPGIMTSDVYKIIESFHSEFNTHQKSSFFNQSFNQNNLRNFTQAIPRDNVKTLTLVLTNQHQSTILGFLENYEGSLMLLNATTLVKLDNRIIGSFDLDLNDMLELIVSRIGSEHDFSKIIGKKIIFTRF